MRFALQNLPATRTVMAVLAALILLIADRTFPPGVGAGLLGLILAGTGGIFRHRRWMPGMAAMGTVLALAGFFPLPSLAENAAASAGRLGPVLLIWTSAAIGWAWCSITTIKQGNGQDLEKFIQERTQDLVLVNERLKLKSEFIQLHKDIAVSSNNNQPMEDAMRYSLERVCRQAGWPVGHVYLPAENSPDSLYPTKLWYLEDPEKFKTFREITELTPLPEGIGLPGRVKASGKPAWIMDVTHDPNFPRAKLAEDIGVRAGFAFPILIGSEVVGVMEFFSAHAVEPDEKLLDIMGNIGNLLGRVLERKRSEDRGKSYQKQLRQLYYRLELVREEERTGIAREIHDELGQVLTTLKLELSLLDNKLAVKNPALRSNTQLMLDLIGNTIQQVKKISSQLRPPILDVLGLADAIQWQGEDFQKRTGIRFQFSQEPQEIHPDSERATTLFRIFQEALTNAARHAQASKIKVNLKDEGDILTLQVKDDGIGIASAQVTDPGSLGLLGMRERTLVWGGHFDIRGVPDEGTTITIKIKHRDPC